MNPNFNPPDLKDPVLNPPAEVVKIASPKMKRSKSAENLQDLKTDDKGKHKKSVFTRNSAKAMKFKNSKVVRDILEDKESEPETKISQLEERKKKIKENYSLYMKWLANMEGNQKLTFDDYKAIREVREKQTNTYYQNVDDISNSIDYVKYMKNMNELQDMFSTKNHITDVGSSSKADSAMKISVPEEEKADVKEEVHNKTPEKKRRLTLSTKASNPTSSGIWNFIRSPKGQKVSQKVLQPEEDNLSEQGLSSSQIGDLNIEFYNDVELFSNPNIDPQTEKGFLMWSTKVTGERGNANSPDENFLKGLQSPNQATPYIDESEEFETEAPLDFLTPSIRIGQMGGGGEDEEHAQMKDLIEDVVKYFLD